MKRLLLAILCLFSSGASAAPITYTLQTTGDGSLGSAPFSNSSVSLSLSGDTADITSPFPGIFTLLGTGSVAVQGIGSATFTNAINIVANQTVSRVGISDLTALKPILFVEHPAVKSYALATPIGPLPGGTLFNIGDSHSTDRGNFSFTSSQTGTFTAVASAVPEPLTAALVGIGVAVLAVYRRRA